MKNVIQQKTMTSNTRATTTVKTTQTTKSTTKKKKRKKKQKTNNDREQYVFLVCPGRCPKNTTKEPKKAPRGSAAHTKSNEKIPKARSETLLDQHNQMCEPVGGFCEPVGMREFPEGLPSHDPRDI